MSISTITVGGITPALRILGADQLFNFSQPNSSFQLNNSFTPTALIPSTTRLEFNNNLYSGFRWTQQTTNTDTHGSLTLQSFVNASSSGTDLMTFTNAGNLIIEASTSMSTDLDLNSHKIINSADPENPQDLATKAYVDTKASANIYMSGNATDTTITATVFTKVLGTTTANHLQYFTSPASNNLVFKGDTANAFLSSTLTVQHDFVGGTELSFAFYLNNSAISPTITNYCVLPNVAVSIATSAFAELIIDDEIELRATAANNCKIIVTDANISVMT